MTKEEFIRRFRDKMVGVIVTGRFEATRLFTGATFASVAEVGEVFNNLGPTADAALSMFYDALNPPPKPAPLPINGARAEPMKGVPR